MKRLREEKGNALLLVLLVTVVVSTIGLAVVSSTIGGAKRTTVRVADVDVTYEAVKAIDSYSARLSQSLREDPNLSIDSLTLSEELDPSFDMLLEGLTNSIENDLLMDPLIEAVETVDVTEDRYNIDSKTTLTRVLQVSITAEEADRGSVSRTATKELIVSPLPSFLKYALGSEKGTLSLHGSPHFQGDLFANSLSIQKQAEYETSSGTKLRKETPMPSLSGDLYVGTPGSYEGWDFDPTELAGLLTEDNFYKGKVPLLKNDSQYQSIDFDSAYAENRAAADEKTAVPEPFDSSTLTNEAKSIAASSSILYESKLVGGILKSVLRPLSAYADSAPSVKNINYIGDAVLRPTGELIQNLRVKGALTIFVEEDITLENIYVSSGVLKIVQTGGTLQLKGNIVSDQGIQLENKQGTFTSEAAVLYDEVAIDIQNDSDMTLGETYSRGDVIVTNGSGSLVAAEALQSGTDSVSESSDIILTNNTGEMDILAAARAGENLIVSNNGLLSLEAPEEGANTFYADKNLNISSTGELSIKNHLEADGSITLDLTKKASIESLLLSNDNINLYAKESTDNALYLDGSLFSEGDVTIQGDDEEGNDEENDTLSLDGTMYAKGKTNISNLSIRGWQDGQLVSLSKESLLITRINEFQNFGDSDEPDGGPYVPQSDDVIQPLKGFFYTDKDVVTDGSPPAADLYGVGSLFFVEGGLFAKGDFLINAVRGETDGFDIKSAVPSEGMQEDHFSRFIVNYDRNILLGQLDYLPKVEHLSLYSDQLIVE